MPRSESFHRSHPSAGPRVPGLVGSGLFRLGFACAITAVLFPRSYGHGLIHDQITTLTGQLKEHPGQPEILIRRAELQRDHGNLEAARADLMAAIREHPEEPAPLLVLARIEREANRLPAARRNIDAYLARQPEDPAGHRENALIHTAVEQWTEAAEAWSASLQHDPCPQPEPFLAAARAYQSAASSPAATRRALAVLQQGIGKHPKVIPLREQAASTCIRLGRFADARGHFGFLLTAHPNLRPRLLANQGAIWLRHGRRSDALAAYRNARAAFDSLPDARRLQPGFQSLDQAIDQALASLITP